MPKKLDDMVKALIRDGYSKPRAFAIATSQLQKSGYLKKGTQKLAKKKSAKKKTKKKSK